MDAEEQAYGEIPYEARPVPWTAPEQLSLLSQLHGGPAPRVREARLVELGCNDGSNLMPLAFYRRDSSFVGIDLSGAAIERGTTLARALGLENVALHRADLSSAAQIAGAADYVVAHGLLSWISPENQSILLAQIRELLAPDGVAYVSYNTLPGWGPRGLVRDALLRAPAVVEARTLVEQIAAARIHAEFLRSELEAVDHPYSVLMRAELSRMAGFSDAHLAHDLLSRHNRPFWLRDFVGDAKDNGLEYVGDVWLYQPGLAPAQPLVDAVSARMADPIAQEETIDLLRYRQLRCSLLRRAGPLTATPIPAVLPKTSIACSLRPDGPIDLNSSDPVDFAPPDASGAPTGQRLTVTEPALKRVLLGLASSWPASTSWDAVARTPDMPAFVGDTLFQLFVIGRASLRLRPQVESTIDPTAPIERPVANTLVRHEAATYGFATTPTHERFALSPAEREIVARLDGRSIDDIRAELSSIEVAVSADALVARLASWGMLEQRG